MIKLSLTLPVAEEEKLRVKARSLGLSLAGYASQVLRDSLRKETDPQSTELLRAVRAILPAMAEAFGRTQEDATREQIEALAKALLERYDCEVSRVGRKSPATETDHPLGSQP